MIAAQAGVGAATIYNIFGGKRSLAARVLAEALAPLVAIAEREAETLPVESAIEAHLTRLAKVLQQHSDLVPGTLAISRSAPPFWLPEASPGPRQINSLTAPLRTLIRAGQRRGEIETDLDPVECAEMITGLLVVVSHERREPAQALLVSLLASPFAGCSPTGRRLTSGARRPHSGRRRRKPAPTSCQYPISFSPSIQQSSTVLPPRTLRKSTIPSWSSLTRTPSAARDD